jgi:hypothetical protein
MMDGDPELESRGSRSKTTTRPSKSTRWKGTIGTRIEIQDAKVKVKDHSKTNRIAFV